MVIRTVVPSITFSGVTIFDVGEEDFASTIRHKPTQRLHYIIHFVLEGSGTYTTSSPSFSTENTLTEGNAFAIYPSDTVLYLSNPDTPMHYIWVGFEGNESEQLLDYIGFSKENPVIKISNKENVLRAFDEIFDSYENQDNYLLLSKFYNLIAILRQNNESSVKSSFLKHGNSLLQRAENIIRLNINHNIQVQELVNILNVDRSYFSKIFKQYYKISPHAYILRMRLKNAETILKTTNLSISEIVSMLNFTDTYSFSKQFKKLFGYPPAEYRKRVLSNNI